MNWTSSPDLPDLLPCGEPSWTYQKAVRQALTDALEDPAVRIIGQGVTDKGRVYGIVPDVQDDRIIETPVAEAVETGVALGMALDGLKPILIHPRNDFLFCAMDQIANHVAKWQSLYPDTKIPLTIVTVACRGWGSGPQHSQALHGLFAQIPGLDVAVPFYPDDAYFAIRTRCEIPTMVFLDKWLWKLKAKKGLDLDFEVTLEPEVAILGIGYGTALAIQARRKLLPEIKCNVVDMGRLSLVRKITIEQMIGVKRCVLVDNGQAFGRLLGTDDVVAWPFRPVPVTGEAEYFPTVDDVVRAVRNLL